MGLNHLWSFRSLAALFDTELILQRASTKRSEMTSNVYIHPTAEVSPHAEIGAGTRIWHQAQVREGARLGANCIVGKGAYIDFDVQIGRNVKIQNYALVYHGVTVEDGVFCGPHCVFTNDRTPRAVNPDLSLKRGGDWAVTPTVVKKGASIGANAVIVCGVTIGAWSMIGAGAVVTRDVPDHGLVWGNPARLHGFVCACGFRLKEHHETEHGMITVCQVCDTEVLIPRLDWENLHS